MQIVELNLKLPYEGRGKILTPLLEKVRGRIRDIHFSPPNVQGVTEVRMEVASDDPAGLMEELRRIIKGGKLDVKVLTEA